MNLLTDDIEEIAEHVKLRAMARTKVCCLVGQAGEVRLTHPRSRYRVPLDDECIVGTYTSSAPVTDIEDDLVCRMREIQPRRAA